MRFPTIVCSLMILVLNSDNFSWVLVFVDLSAFLDLNYVFRGFIGREVVQLNQSHFHLFRLVFQAISTSNDRILDLG